MARMKVGVVFGGRSVEHDVSIVTAHQVMAVLEAKHEVVPVYVTREGEWLSAPGLNDLGVYKTKRWAEVGERCFLPPVPSVGGLFFPGGRLKGSRTTSLDVIVPAIHGTYGEDGTLQGLLELADIPYAGSGVVGSAVGMDKPAMKAVFKAAGLPVLDHVLVDTGRLLVAYEQVLDDIEERIGYPAFVKPSRLGSSVGIGKGTDREGLREALEVARRYDGRVLVEPAAEDCIEINCSVIGGPGLESQASVCEQPVSVEEFLSFSDKYMRGGKTETSEVGSKSGMAGQDRRIPAPISEEMTKTVQDNALRAFEAVGAAGVARVDAFVKESSGETWVMEINTVPGSFSFYLWEHSGLGFEALMDNLIEGALAAHRAKGELMFTFDSGMLDKASIGERGSKSRG